jgi:hypothetical protein
MHKSFSETQIQGIRKHIWFLIEIDHICPTMLKSTPHNVGNKSYYDNIHSTT